MPIIAPMQGLHLTADLHRCAAVPAMTDPAALRAHCLGAVRESGLTPVGELFHRFDAPAGPAGGPAGITGVVLLAESHLALHTWPELGAVTVDVYVCNFGADNSAKAHALLDALLRVFVPGEVTHQQLQRGAIPRVAAAA